MKFCNSLVLLVGILAKNALAQDAEVTVTDTTTQEEVVISFGGDTRRNLIVTTPDLTESTTDTIIYDNNDITNCNAEGGVCNSAYSCFTTIPKAYSFNKATVKEVCSVDVTFQSVNCGSLTSIPVSINEISIGEFTSLSENCACGECNTYTLHTKNEDVLASINGGTKQELEWDVIGTISGSTGYDPNFCLDRIIIDLHTVCTTTVGKDPHFKTWAGEHYEFHGQCDMVLAKDPEFAHGLGMDIHIRTKLVRFWSYIQNAVIRIGTDILEVTGTGDDNDWEPHYWVNFEYQGELTTIGGFPVTTYAHASAYKRTYEIDMDSVYPGQKIIIQAYKEFVQVKFDDVTAESFGNTVGMFGDYHTGKTVARDGVTEIDSFEDFGIEWQVLPAEPKLFHEIAPPQFPQKCILPEDPRGQRRRRLSESTITEEQAEEACGSLKDPLDRKDCVYDVLATQDMDMVGAF